MNLLSTFLFPLLRKEIDHITAHLTPSEQDCYTVLNTILMEGVFYVIVALLVVVGAIIILNLV